MINVPVDGEISGLETSTAINDAVRSIEGQLGETGRVILRASGTEPLVRVTLEGADESQVRQLAAELADVVRSELAG
jgi:phosphoglucosamine mutase